MEEIYLLKHSQQNSDFLKGKNLQLHSNHVTRTLFTITLVKLNLLSRLQFEYVWYIPVFYPSLGTSQYVDSGQYGGRCNNIKSIHPDIMYLYET